jgi:hypothetical protein
MDETNVREASQGEAETIMQMVRLMVADMANYGPPTMPHGTR